jgi:hypothetical protein
MLIGWMPLQKDTDYEIGMNIVISNTTVQFLKSYLKSVMQSF